MQKINVKLLKYGGENDVITRMIANMNDANVAVSPRDLEGYLNVRNVAFPFTCNYAIVKDTEEPNTYHLSEDGGKTFTMSLEWIEIYVLPENDKQIEAELNVADDLREVFN